MAEVRSRGAVSSSVYRAYCAAGGSCGFTLLVFGVFAVGQVAISSGDYWVSFWYVQLLRRMEWVLQDFRIVLCSKFCLLKYSVKIQKTYHDKIVMKKEKSCKLSLSLKAQMNRKCSIYSLKV